MTKGRLERGGSIGNKEVAQISGNFNYELRTTHHSIIGLTDRCYNLKLSIIGLTDRCYNLKLSIIGLTDRCYNLKPSIIGLTDRCYDLKLRATKENLLQPSGAPPLR
jgi:hypothetical protein